MAEKLKVAGSRRSFLGQVRRAVALPSLDYCR
jgi:hypothetical protein